MDVIIHQSALNDMLRTVMHAIPSNPAFRTLGHVLLVAGGDALKAVGSDMELTIVARKSAVVNSPGGVAVPAKSLAGLVSGLPEADVRLRVDAEWRLHVQCGPAGFSMAGVDPSDYLDIMEPHEDVAVLNPQVLKRAISQVAFAAEDTTLSVLGGVLISTDKPSFLEVPAGEPGTIVLAASNGHHLAVKAIPAQRLLRERFSIIAPAESLQKASRLLGRKDDRLGEVLIRLGEEAVCLHIGEAAAIIRTMKGNFPRYQQLFLREHRTWATVEAAQLLEACRKVHAFQKASRPTRHLWKDRQLHEVRMHLDPGSTILISGENEDGAEICVAVPGEVRGERLERIVFNCDYLLGMLEAVGRKEILVFHLAGPEEHAVVTLKADGSFAYAIAPVLTPVDRPAKTASLADERSGAL